MPTTVLVIETRLAKASLTITEQRDPQNLTIPPDVVSFALELTHFPLPEYCIRCSRSQPLVKSMTWSQSSLRSSTRSWPTRPSIR